MTLKVKGPDSVQRRIGHPAELRLKITGGAVDGVVWRKDGVPLEHVNTAQVTNNGVSTSTLKIAKLALADKGRYDACVTGSGQSSLSDQATLDVRDSAAPAATQAQTQPAPAEPAPAASAQDTEPPLVFDSDFALRAAVALFLVGGLLLWPILWVVARRVLGHQLPSSTDLVSLEFLMAGIAILLGAAYAVLMELRGRMRLIEQAPRAMTRALGFTVDDKLLTAFGTLKPAAALMVCALGLFAGAALLATRAAG